ncbi:multidrug MFS transporter [Alteromonas sp. KC3]|uniref:sugar transferase n=2 Tax=Alteromonas TaxID=226 RepID=UPI0019218BFD|nr:sugar transferase [Alteromonas sp. KC14]BCO20255.1 multidrug MFS transporter [Alteromonas sp. KC3]BCO24221.1 multidrug MFS transporter [Alteromonas sp. KC14]
MKTVSTKFNHNATNHKGLPIAAQKIVALLGLVALSPLLIIVATLIKLESRGPLIFSQTRVGEQGRQFKCFKFRSMYTPDSPQWEVAAKMKSDREGICQKMYSDPRITRVGRVIRKLSIDELPQLFNVLTGDMVLVGPRPHLTSEYEQYDTETLVRLNCKPGLTGLWQVSGRADTTFEEQLMLDKTYIAQQSWFFDVKILLATVPAVVTARGAY